MKKNLKLVAFSAILLMLAGSFFSCGKDTNQGGLELDWGVRFTLKSQFDKNYLATEDPEILDLVAKHHIIRFCLSYPGAKTPELLLCYDLIGHDKDNKENKARVIKDFLATGKFEDEVYDYGTAHSE